MIALTGVGAHVVYLLAAVAAGFGLGRIKNKAKLAAITAEISALEAKVKGAVTVVKDDIVSFIDRVKAKL